MTHVASIQIHTDAPGVFKALVSTQGNQAISPAFAQILADVASNFDIAAAAINATGCTCSGTEAAHGHHSGCPSIGEP